MKILFLTNETTLTGAPVHLLTFLEWLQASCPAEIRIISLYDGSLLNRFEKTGKVLLLGRQRGKLGTYFQFALKEMVPPVPGFIEKTRISMFLQNFRPDLVYVNSVIPLKIVEMIPDIGKIPVLCHVLESQMAIRNTLGESGFGPYDRLIDRYLATGAGHAEILTARFGIPVEKITVIPPVFQPRKDPGTRSVLRQNLGISPETFMVLGCGKISWFKSPELFIMTAAEVVKQTRRPIRFLWVGKKDQPDFYSSFLPGQEAQLQQDIEKAGLHEVVEFTGFRDNLDDYYAASDLFFLSSREDTFPLVGLEAASYGKPILCFQDAGGMPEFVRDDAGFTVPYLDVAEAARCILTLMDNPGLQDRMGETGRIRCRTLHDISATGPQILSVLTQIRQG